ncbi:MAG: site-specific DNA-methyltransferase [Bacteroidaceae bacterium]|nr:site-specific DNA-methyltransferase [Bacteroidaceae bacterium]
MEKLKMQSHDVIGSNTQKIAQLFPNCVTERLGKGGKPELAIDFEKLQAELSNEIIAEGEERYQFTWPDKRVAVRLANMPTTMTLRPCREESMDFDNTQNLYIEGDNLDVLKVLRETYLGKVKMIYIDPPYNTGNDFVYNDDFAQSKAEFEAQSGLFDDEGNRTVDPMVQNTESNGRFHTDWLNMIYPRLKVAKDLLSGDGVIFISIGDAEINNLHKICNEIYGESNFIAKVVIITGANQAGEGVLIQKNIEYVLCFSKNINNAIINRVDKTEESWRNLNDAPTPLITRPDMGYTIYYNPTTEEMIPIFDYDKTRLSSNDENIIYSTDLNLVRKGFVPVRPGKRNGSLHRWRWGIETFKERIAEIKMFSNKGNYIPKFMQGGFNPPKNYHNFSGGASELKLLFGEKTPFDYPKGLTFLKYIVSIGAKQDSIILDFFSGSATTAHAVMKLNAEDGGNRKFIMVQLPEKTDEKSEAHKAGYKNICEIGKERIRRAGKKVKEEAGLSAQNLDTGFRVLKLDSSNMEEVYYTPQEFELQSLFNENVKADRTNEDLLFQVMLDLGIELSAKIECKQIAGKSVHLVDDNYLVACFDRDVNESAITEIAKLQPIYFVMRDASAANDNVIDNFEQIFKHYSPDTNCRII